LNIGEINDDCVLHGMTSTGRVGWGETFCEQNVLWLVYPERRILQSY